MSDDDRRPNHLVCFNGRECSVEYIQLEGAAWFDVCLFDADTGDIVAFCTRPDSSVSLDAQQALVRPEFVDMLEVAGIARSTGEVVASERFGELCKCDLPYGPTHLAWEPDNSPRQAAVREHREALAQDDREFDIEH